jgi:hypothetical protein
MSENYTSCGNPACPTKPPIAERSDLPTELRQPCPACGSLSRSFAALVQESVLSGSGTLSAGGLAVTATITAEAGVIPAAKISLHGLPVTHEIVVVYSDLSDQPDPACIIEVQTREGELLAMGSGLSPADALLLVRAHVARLIERGHQRPRRAAAPRRRDVRVAQLGQGVVSQDG